MDAWQIGGARRFACLATVWSISFSIATSHSWPISLNPWGHSSTVRYEIIVHTNASTAVCEKEFLSIAIDSNSITKGWAGFDFNSRKMKNMAAALGPCDVRLGGIMADFLIFVPQRTQNPQTFMNLYSTSTQNRPLFGDDWDTFTTFAKNVGWKAIFDFNIFLRSNGLWNASNAELFLNYSSDRGIEISGFQLGNEPAHYPRVNNINITPRNISADLSVLRNLISKYSLYKHSSIYGPSVTHTGSSMAYLRNFFAVGGANFTNATDIHHYYCDGRLATLEDFLNVTILDSLKGVFNTVFTSTTKLPQPTRLILSETSSCYGGGKPGLSNAYVAGFMWLDKLGVSALYGLPRVVRQSFIGASYQLISPSKFIPNPDFYLSVVFKQLVEGPVFPVTFTPAHARLRVYANCARRDVFRYRLGVIVVYFLNLDVEKATLSLTQFPNVDRHVFLLTPGDKDGLNSRLVNLNGLPLTMSVDDKVPELKYVSQTGDIIVPGQTFGFITIPLANVSACRSYFTRTSN